MGARGPAAKRPSMALSAVPVGAPFDPPENLCAEAMAQWDAYWSDPVSTSPTAADRGVVLRWIESLNRYVLYQRAADEEPVVRGSMGQPVKNPMHALATEALAVVERCEKQLGIGGKNRADLGIAIVAGQKSLAELNAAYQESDADEEPAAEEDPRVVKLQAKKSS